MLFETPCTFHILLLLPIYCSFILLYYGIFYFSTKFSGAGKQYSWCPDDPADQDDEDAFDPSIKLGNLLLLKSMVLLPSAKAGEESVVQVESEVYNNCKV